MVVDINTFSGSRDPGWVRWLVVRLGLFAIGHWVGGPLWELFSDEPTEERWLGERLISNIYFWACLVATGLYALYDRRRRGDAV